MSKYREISVLSYTGRDTFCDSRSPERHLRLIEEYKPNIAFIREAYQEDAKISNTVKSIESSKQKYYVAARPNEDGDGRLDKHGNFALTDLHVQSRDLRLGERNAQRFDISELGLTAIMWHGFDRDNRDYTNSEKMRLDQIRDLPKDLKANVLFITSNFMAANSLRARTLRVVRPILKPNIWPISEPGVEYQGAKIAKPLARAVSLGRRLGEMADGRTSAAFESRGMRNIDPNRRATQGIFTLSHILVSSAVEVVSFDVLNEEKTRDNMPITDKPILARLRMPVS